MTQQEAQVLVKKHGGYKQAARAIGMAKSTFGDIARGITTNPRGNTVKPMAVAGIVQPCKKKTLSEFRATYDKAFIVPRRIKDGIKKLGITGWEYEVQFAKIAGISLTDLAAYRDQFAENVIQISRDGRRAWAGSASTAQQMREMVS